MILIAKKRGMEVEVMCKGVKYTDGLWSPTWEMREVRRGKSDR